MGYEGCRFFTTLCSFEIQHDMLLTEHAMRALCRSTESCRKTKLE